MRGKKSQIVLSKNLLCEKIKKNRPGGDVVSITQRQVKKKTNITHIPYGLSIIFTSRKEKVIRGYN